MKKALLVFGFFSLVVGCSGSTDDPGASRSDRVVLDVRCNADTDCPAGFECEVEDEHGVSTSYCKSHQSSSSGSTSGSTGTGTSPCPPGFEQETEHGGIFCKPHGGDDGGKNDGGASTSSGGAAAGAACTTDADCASGLECETELEHGVTTSFCKPHGGGKGGKS